MLLDRLANMEQQLVNWMDKCNDLAQCQLAERRRQELSEASGSFIAQPTADGAESFRAMASHAGLGVALVPTTVGRVIASAHNGKVFACVFTPDNKTLLTGGEDSAVKLWCVDSGGLQRVLRCDRIGLWGLRELKRGGATQTLAQHTQSVIALDVHESGSIAVSGSNDKSINVWSLRTHRSEVRRCMARRHRLRAAAGFADRPKPAHADRSQRPCASASADFQRGQTGVCWRGPDDQAVGSRTRRMYAGALCALQRARLLLTASRVACRCGHAVCHVHLPRFGRVRGSWPNCRVRPCRWAYSHLGPARTRQGAH